MAYLIFKKCICKIVCNFKVLFLCLPLLMTLKYSHRGWRGGRCQDPLSTVVTSPTDKARALPRACTNCKLITHKKKTRLTWCQRPGPKSELLQCIPDPKSQADTLLPGRKFFVGRRAGYRRLQYFSEENSKMSCFGLYQPQLFSSTLHICLILDSL